MTNNPIKVARDSLGLTQVQAATQLRINESSYIKLEQGQPSNLSGNILKFASNALGLDPIDVLKAYYDFQFDTRQRNYGLLDARYLWSGYHENPGLPTHPFISWLAVTNAKPYDVAKNLCVNYSNLERFIKKPAVIATIPEQLLTALKESGYSLTQRQRLQDTYINWRKVRYDVKDRRVYARKVKD